jgi:AcrR family transcriptional regulator
MPTGVALRDPREQLFAAAERILLRAGPNALTSRAVTDEAGVAKGVLHRHFADFDVFLTELVNDRIRRLDADPLPASAGTGTVTGNVTAALTRVFGPVAVGIVGLVTARDGLRARLRAAGLTGIPLLAQATSMIAGYLAAERELGRLAAGADVDALALTLVGSAHMLFAGAEHPPAEQEVHRVVATVLAGVTPQA